LIIANYIGISQSFFSVPVTVFYKLMISIKCDNFSLEVC